MAFIGEDALDTHTYIYKEGCLQIPKPPPPPLPIFIFCFAPPNLFILDCVKLETWKPTWVYMCMSKIFNMEVRTIIYFHMFLVILLIFLSFCRSDFNIVFLLHHAFSERMYCRWCDKKKKKALLGHSGLTCQN